MKVTTPYTQDFYKSIQDGSLRSAHEIIPLIIQNLTNKLNSHLKNPEFT